jgi:hypothetical protein
LRGMVVGHRSLGASMADKISTNPAWRARRRRKMLLPLLIGVTLLALAGWAYATQTSFARHAVTTTAAVQEVHQGPFHDSQTGRRTFAVLGTVRYQVDQVDVRATVTLVAHCDGSPPCLRRYQPGDQVAVAYDPDHPREAVPAIGRPVRYPAPAEPVVLLIILACMFLGAAIAIYVLGP